ncbi:MAG: hypothetical protein HZA50_13440 [Planctomycetes bacterium]|nr:hypothetical protein [Planctomycetota bacterium]
MNGKWVLIPVFAAVMALGPAGLLGQTGVDVGNTNTDTWITAEGSAGGLDLKAQDEAKNQALRKAVEKACGVFINAQSKAQDYKLVYDKIMANTVGYVVESKDPKFTKDEAANITICKITCRVSTRKFEEDWALIAHTKHQEGNPRVIIVIAETTEEMVKDLLEENKSDSTSTVETKIEGTVTDEALRTANITRSGEGYVWIDSRNRRWLFGGRTTTEIQCISGEQVTEEEKLAARRHFQSVIKTTAASQGSSTKAVWKRLAATIEEKGTVQTKLEEFLLSKDFKLVDQSVAKDVNKRDIMLAMGGDDMAAVSALGAKFHADVVILGTATVKQSGQREINVAGTKANMFTYSGRLVVRAIRTDSAQLIVSRAFGPYETTSMKQGDEAKMLADMADKAAPELLKSVIEAWRKQVNVTRNVSIMISGMDFAAWKTFKAEMEKLRGVQNLRLREITESVANIDAEYDFTAENLADNMTSLKETKLAVTEISPNRIKAKVVK